MLALQRNVGVFDRHMYMATQDAIFHANDIFATCSHTENHQGGMFEKNHHRTFQR
jgi:hypothetical protein